jgi:hypothetical protein
MTRRGWWIVSFLTVTAAAVGGELYAAFDSSSNTTPWTELIVRYVPWPITALAIAVLVIWLPLHFFSNYRHPEVTVAQLDPNKPQPSEPLLTRMGIVAGVTAAIDLVMAFGVHLSTAQDVAILGVTNAIAVPLVLGLWARRTVFSPATVARLLSAKGSGTPTTPPAVPPVA